MLLIETKLTAIADIKCDQQSHTDISYYIEKTYSYNSVQCNQFSLTVKYENHCHISLYLLEILPEKRCGLHALIVEKVVCWRIISFQHCSRLTQMSTHPAYSMCGNATANHGPRCVLSRLFNNEHSLSKRWYISVVWSEKLTRVGIVLTHIWDARLNRWYACESFATKWTATVLPHSPATNYFSCQLVHVSRCSQFCWNIRSAEHAGCCIFHEIFIRPDRNFPWVVFINQYFDKETWRALC